MITILTTLSISSAIFATTIPCTYKEQSKIPSSNDESIYPKGRYKLLQVQCEAQIKPPQKWYLDSCKWNTSLKKVGWLINQKLSLKDPLRLKFVRKEWRFSFVLSSKSESLVADTLKGTCPWGNIVASKSIKKEIPQPHSPIKVHEVAHYRVKSLQIKQKNAHTFGKRLNPQGEFLIYDLRVSYPSSQRAFPVSIQPQDWHLQCENFNTRGIAMGKFGRKAPHYWSETHSALKLHQFKKGLALKSVLFAIPDSLSQKAKCVLSFNPKSEYKE